MWICYPAAFGCNYPTNPGINIPIFEVDVNLVEFADNAVARGRSVAPQTLGVAVVTMTVPGKKVVVGSALRHALISLEEVSTGSAERQTKATARFALRVTHHAALENPTGNNRITVVH